MKPLLRSSIKLMLFIFIATFLLASPKSRADGIILFVQGNSRLIPVNPDDPINFEASKAKLFAHFLDNLPDKLPYGNSKQYRFITMQIKNLNDLSQQIAHLPTHEKIAFIVFEGHGDKTNFVLAENHYFNGEDLAGALTSPRVFDHLAKRLGLYISACFLGCMMDESSFQQTFSKSIGKVLALNPESGREFIVVAHPFISDGVLRNLNEQDAAFFEAGIYKMLDALESQQFLVGGETDITKNLNQVEKVLQAAAELGESKAELKLTRNRMLSLLVGWTATIGVLNLLAANPNLHIPSALPVAAIAAATLVGLRGARLRYNQLKHDSDNQRMIYELFFKYRNESTDARILSAGRSLVNIYFINQFGEVYEQRRAVGNREALKSVTNWACPNVFSTSP